MLELTTSKVNRQFRSLRSKCVALASFSLAPAKPTVSITYGRNASRRATESDETPPLAILQSLDKFSTRLHFDRAIVETMQLSKRIYEVRDAFKHIVQSVFGHQAGQHPPRILPLTALCARVVGEHIQSEVVALKDDRSDTECRTEDDEMRTQVLEELYEDVLTPYRHYTMVAHALSYILDTCPHHPTLLNSLLEVCIAHDLAPEARLVLFELFTTAIQPRPHPTSPCPLTHPAHKNFLTTLHDTCGASEHLSAIHLINSRTFVRTLVDALSQPCPEQLQAWTSKAVTRLARDFRKQDFAGCFIPLCIALAHTLAEPINCKRRQVAKISKGDEDPSSTLRENALERLAKWIVSMLDTLRSCIGITVINGSEEYLACVDFLVAVEPLRFHIGETQSTSPSACLVDALCCLATFCLASPFAPPRLAADPDHLTIESLLRASHTTNDTFDGLVSYTFPHPSVSVYRVDPSEIDKETPTPPPMALTAGDGGLDAIDSLASALRVRELLRCEVVLYHQTLRHVEDLISAPAHAIPPEHQLSEKVMYQLRMQLMDRIEDAERRCYGGASAGAPQPPEGGCAWRWEEMVGSWVLESPAPAQAKKIKEKNFDRASKRRRIGEASSSRSQSNARNIRGPREGNPRRSDFRVPSNESSDGGMITFAHAHDVSGSKKRKAPSVDVNRPALRPGPTVDSRDKENISDGENESGAPIPAPKRVWNFATILADAQTNVISLRAERKAEAQTKAQARAKGKGRVSAPARVFAVLESPASVSVSVTRGGVPSSRPPRRLSSFATSLADSHRNSICLREERARERERAERAHKAKAVVELKRTKSAYTYGRMSSEEEEDAGCEQVDGLDPESSPVRAQGVAEPSSDDALNLFAYPDSSPIAASRRRVLR